MKTRKTDANAGMLLQSALHIGDVGAVKDMALYGGLTEPLYLMSLFDQNVCACR
jgi:hypothetical protein